MRFGFLVIILVSVAAAAAQSGRQKPSPSPTPLQITGPSVIHQPAPEKSSPIVSTAAPAPTPKPKLDDDVIKVEAALVPIPVSVLDSSGVAVTNLKLADFELKVDGKPVEIGDLARSETPIRLAMLFDNSSSVLIARDFEKEAAQRFFKQILRPDKDMAALFSVADYTRLEQPMTRDVSQLLRAIDMFPEPKGATALLDGIVEASEYLQTAFGRRVIVIVSDGEDTYSDYKTTLEYVVKVLQLNNIQVYVVKTKDFENYKRTGIRGGNANIRTLTAERRMIEIGEQTGGAVYSPIDEDEVRDAFKKISAELSQQYILSYYPETLDRADEYRTITLAVRGRKDLTIRTRKGYYIPRR